MGSRVAIRASFRITGCPGSGKIKLDDAVFGIHSQGHSLSCLDGRIAESLEERLFDRDNIDHERTEQPRTRCPEFVARPPGEAVREGIDSTGPVEGEFLAEFGRNGTRYHWHGRIRQRCEPGQGRLSAERGFDESFAGRIRRRRLDGETALEQKEGENEGGFHGRITPASPITRWRLGI